MCLYSVIRSTNAVTKLVIILSGEQIEQIVFVVMRSEIERAVKWTIVMIQMCSFLGSFRCGSLSFQYFIISSSSCSAAGIARSR